MLQKINRGDVYFYNFGFDYDGSVEGKNRPCVIISNDKGNNFGTTALVAPITTRSKDSCKPWQVHYYNNGKSQVVLCEQIKTVNISKLYNYQGKLDVLTMKAIDEALAIEFDLNVTQKEQDSTEFLHRLDYALDRIIGKQLVKYEMKINDIISNAIATANNTKNEYEELCNKVIDKVSEIVSNNTSIMDGINDIKKVFNQNANNLDKILASLINIYKDINNSKDMSINVHSTLQKSQANELKIETDTKADEFISKNETEIKKEVKSSRPRYTVEYAKEFIKDYYNMDKKSFMSKYSLINAVMINNRLTTMKNLLKRSDIDWKNIRDNIVIYNINDLSEEEKRAKFSNYLKENKTLVTITKNKKSEPEIYKNANKPGNNTLPGHNKGSKHKFHAERFDYSKENCLAFIDEWNETLFVDMCKKYNMTHKQMSSRKYLICKWLLENNIEFKVANKRKESYKRR